jgi:hypothetical protein
MLPKRAALKSMLVELHSIIHVVVATGCERRAATVLRGVEGGPWSRRLVITETRPSPSTG